MYPATGQMVLGDFGLLLMSVIAQKFAVWRAWLGVERRRCADIGCGGRVERATQQQTKAGSEPTTGWIPSPQTPLWMLGGRNRSPEPDGLLLADEDFGTTFGVDLDLEGDRGGEFATAPITFS
ncbi:hypothetical protein B0H13DRAFT_1852013 [Mycena leptocephala]|nr:hypothetical protein B0H13DRAFT_1852013 [Mycena leptocephala]